MISVDSIPDTTHRFSDSAAEPCDVKTPLEGFSKKPLKTLEETCEPIKHLVPGIEKYACVAKARVKNPADDLSIDESAAIALYTMEWEPFNQTLYYILNSTLRNEERERLKPWFLYLKLILTALSRLPSISTVVYRGINSKIDGEGRKYCIGKVTFWWGFSSCSQCRDIAERDKFLDGTGTRTLFIIDCINGKDISKHSYYGNEREVLLLPATEVLVTKNENRGSGLRVINLKEIESKHKYLEQISTVEEINELKERSKHHFKFFPIKSLLNHTERSYNAKLHKYLVPFEPNSEVYLNNKGFKEADLNLIVEEVVIGKQCRELSLRGTGMTCKGASIIAKSLHDNQHLLELKLSHNSIGDKGVRALTQALYKNNNTTLKGLSLGYNCITDQGVNYIADMLATNETLTHLYLHQNKITDQGLKRLVDVLITSNKTKLEVLSLEKNEFTDKSSVVLLMDLLKKNRALRSLNINRCQLSSSAMKKLRTLFRDRIAEN